MQQTGILFYKFRFLFALIMCVAFLMLISALVTAIGSNSVLAHPQTNTLSTDASADNPYILAAGANAAATDTKHAMLSASSSLYKACRSITTSTDQIGKTIGHGSAVIVSSIWDGAWHSTVFVARGVANSVIFTLRIPGKIVGFISYKHAVSSLISPSDSQSVPVINDETSAAVLSRFNAQQQQEIAQLQATQLAANRSLGGMVIAGDPNHGGYPTTWANVQQDSSLDRWGMFNRECVSYTAWKVYQMYGFMPYWGGVGNANEWPSDAQSEGIKTGSTPQVGSVAISMSGYYGHAMWVEKVSGDMIYVSQYNYDLHGDYSEMWVNGSHFTYIYFK